MGKRRLSSTPSGVQKKKPKKIWGVKQVLASPYTANFPSSNAETLSKTIEALQTTFPRPIATRKSRPCKNSTLPQKPFENIEKPNGFLIGINEITRALERRQVNLAVVCRDATPNILISHLPALCFTAGAKMIVLPGEGSELTNIFGTRRTLAFAICKHDDMQCVLSEQLHDLTRRLMPLTCTLKFPWLAEHDGSEHGKVVKFPDMPSVIAHRGKEQRTGKVDNVQVL